jgi:multidrug efflux pump subunit AcrB
MISRFFIDRPIFATVVSLVIGLTGLIALFSLPVAQYPRIVPPGVNVSISYPGANAQVVADTVAAPIEQQFNGLDGLLYMSSQSGNDGTYSLTITFDIGTNLNTALVMVQNRVALAMQQLPSSVQNQGITIRKKTPDMLMIVNFISDGRYDDIYLSNFATLYVRDELLRVEGVSDVNYMGQRDYSIRAWLNPQKLAALGLTPIDVSRAIKNQNMDAPAGQLGQPPASSIQSIQLPITTLGRLSKPEEFEEIIVKVGQPPSQQQAPVRVPKQSNLPNPETGSSGASVIASSTTIQPPQATITTDAPMSTAATANSSTPSTTTQGVSTSGGGSTGGGGTAGGGGSTGGGGTTGGAATPGNMIPIPSLGRATSSGIATGSPSRLPPDPSPGIVRLRDVATVELGAQNYNQSCMFDGQPSVGLSVYQLPTTNALEAANRVRDKMEELSKRFPAGIKYTIGYDTTPYIRDSVMDVLKTFVEAVALVGLVVLIFLQDWRAMILPMIDVPVSIIGTFAVMALVGFSLNNISLFGLVLAIGIVVDDAIVVLENIERLMATGLDARTATIKAMEEVTGPIVAVGLVLCAVFVPCALIPGITGQFFRQFAVTISVSTVISAINAITMTPSRAVLIFKAQEAAHKAGRKHTREALPWWIFGVIGGGMTFWFSAELMDFFNVHLPADIGSGMSQGFAMVITGAIYAGPGLLLGLVIGWFIIHPVNAMLGAFFRGFNLLFDGLTAGYGWTIGKSLRVSALVLFLYAGLLGLTYVVFTRAPAGFIPQQDQGRIIVTIQLPDSSSLERTKAAAKKVTDIALADKGVAHAVTISGLSFVLQANSSNFASMFIVLKPFDERQKPGMRDTDIMARLRQRWTNEVQEAMVTAFPSAPIPGLGTAGGYKIVVEDRGGLGLRALQTQTELLVSKIQATPELGSATTQFRSRTPQLFLDIDRAKVASLGVNLDDVNQTLDMYLGSLYVSTFNAFGRHWQVTIQAQGEYRDQLEAVNLFKVRNQAGQMVPLGTLVKLREIGGPISITRYNLYTAATITGNVPLGTSTGDAIDAVNKLSSEYLPISMGSDWTEIMKLQIDAGNTALYVFALGVLCVFLALSALYESWALPLAVILVVPLCLLCSLAGVLLTNRDVNIFVQIGLVVLVGLACKNAILIVEYARQLHTQGRTIREATEAASRLRLRPILMTSAAFIFGVIPLVVASGAGAEMRRSLGIAVFSGMIGVTAFGIFLTPVFFYVLQGVGETRLLSAAMTRWIGSTLAGGLLGGMVGHLLAMLDVVPLLWGPIIGAFSGTLLVVGILEMSRMYRELIGAPEAARGAGTPPASRGADGSPGIQAGEPPAPRQAGEPTARRPDGGPTS